MSAKLYEPCTACDENGKLHGVNQFGIFVEAPCSCRGTKFQEIGLTVNQLERLTRKADGLDRIARLVQPIDLVELGEAADWLRVLLRPEEADRVVAAQEALAGVGVVVRDVRKPLGNKGVSSNG